MTPRVAVVGAGISGAACASALHAHGIEVEVFERSRTPGGRMAAPLVNGRRMDLGAAYLTATDDAFVAVVDGWVRRGLVRAWTDTFTVLDAGGRRTTSGPVRYATRNGLRSLVRDLLPVDALLGHRIDALDELDHDAVVLAMPDPQALRLTNAAVDWVRFRPVITVALHYPERSWDDFDAAFVNDDAVVTLVADDGARRGDGAPVLVAHTGHVLASAHLDDPDAVVPRVRAALSRLLDLDAEPLWARTHRWTFAKPDGTHGDAPFGVLDHHSRPLGLATDSWCPSGTPRIESAWLAGDRLGQRLASEL